MKALRISGLGLSPDWNCLYVKINLASFRDKSSGVRNHLTSDCTWTNP